MKLNLGRLAAWRANVRPDGRQCRILFGISPETLERIEARDVEPDDEVAERIGRFLTQLPSEPVAPPDLARDRHDRSLNSSPASAQAGAGDPLGAARPKFNAALTRKGIDIALIDQLKLVPTGTKPHLGDIRRAIITYVGECTRQDLLNAIERLRMQGKIHWSRLELSPSMVADGRVCGGEPPNPRRHSIGRGPDGASKSAPPPSAPSAQQGNRSLAIARSGAARAGQKPVPPPQHESEAAKAVREDADAAQARRNAARSGGSKSIVTGQMSLVETVSSMLAEDPADLIIAINRRHKRAWGRILQLGRQSGKRPGEALYDALERGLSALEEGSPGGALVASSNQPTGGRYAA